MLNQTRSGIPSKIILIMCIIITASCLSACGKDDGSSPPVGKGFGVKIAHGESYDRDQDGIRLILTHDPKYNTFIGFVENLTNDTLNGVRIELHLSNGVVLGPTSPVDLVPGERKDINISAKNYIFENWTVHLEIEES